MLPVFYTQHWTTKKNDVTTSMGHGSRKIGVSIISHIYIYYILHGTMGIYIYVYILVHYIIYIYIKS